jgi:hypothetical protein
MCVALGPRSSRAQYYYSLAVYTFMYDLEVVSFDVHTVL